MEKNNGPGVSRSVRVTSTTKLSLVASLSALYLVFRLIPTFPMFGVPGATFRAGDMVAPLYGVVLGPLLGPVAIIIGTLVGFFTGAPPVFLGLDFFPAVSCSVIVGLATRAKRVLGSVLYSALILVFLLLPFTSIVIHVGGYSVPFVWLHLVGLALYVSPLTGRAVNYVTRDWTSYAGKVSGYFERQIVAVLVLAFEGTLAQHIVGGMLTQLVVGINFHSIPGRFHTWQDFWTLVFWAYPFERTVITLVATGIGAASLVALKASGLTHRLPKL